MKNTFKVSGVIKFDPKDITNKHIKQSKWKKVALIMLEPELGRKEKGITEYYSWFIKKRFNLPLIKPFRDAHITFVNDRSSDMKKGDWEKVKKKWNGKVIDVTIHVDPFLGIKTRGDNFYDWWLIVPNECRDEIHSIRTELGLPERPYFGLHMTIGTAVDFYPDFKEDYEFPKQYAIKYLLKNEEHSKYILELAKNDLLNLD